MGLAFLMTGVAFKIAAVPFHWWAPDVYQWSDEDDFFTGTPIARATSSANRSAPISRPASDARCAS